MHRLLVLVSMVFTLALVIPFPALAQDATPAAPVTRTDRHIVLPYGPDGLNSTLTVTATERGACQDDSLAASFRPDAWECTGESDRIFDPCFDNPFASADTPGEVACLTSPFSNEVVVLTLDAPLPRSKEISQSDGPFAPWDLPWGVELANGEQCLLLEDVETVLAGEGIYYACTDGGVILGEMRRGDDVWVVHYLPSGAASTSLVDVTAAWS